MLVALRTSVIARDLHFGIIVRVGCLGYRQTVSLLSLIFSRIFVHWRLILEGDRVVYLFVLAMA